MSDRVVRRVCYKNLFANRFFLKRWALKALLFCGFITLKPSARQLLKRKCCPVCPICRRSLARSDEEVKRLMDVHVRNPYPIVGRFRAGGGRELLEPDIEQYYSEITAAPCGHIFHASCLDTYCSNMSLGRGRGRVSVRRMRQAAGPTRRSHSGRPCDSYCPYCHAGFNISQLLCLFPSITDRLPGDPVDVAVPRARPELPRYRWPLSVAILLLFVDLLISNVEWADAPVLDF